MSAFDQRFGTRNAPERSYAIVPHTGAVTLVDSSVQRVLAVLRAAVAAETIAEGSARRIAYRTSRHLFGGAIQLGISTMIIADAVGVRPDTIRSRSNLDGLVDGPHFTALSGLPETQVGKWEEAGLIHLEGPDPAGIYGYRASTLLRAHTADDELNDECGP